MDEDHLYIMLQKTGVDPVVILKYFKTRPEVLKTLRGLSAVSFKTLVTVLCEEGLGYLVLEFIDTCPHLIVTMTKLDEKRLRRKLRELKEEFPNLFLQSDKEAKKSFRRNLRELERPNNSGSLSKYELVVATQEQLITHRVASPRYVHK